MKSCSKFPSGYDLGQGGLGRMDTIQPSTGGESEDKMGISTRKNRVWMPGRQNLKTTDVGNTT